MAVAVAGIMWSALFSGRGCSAGQLVQGHGSGYPEQVPCRCLRGIKKEVMETTYLVDTWKQAASQVQHQSVVMSCVRMTTVRLGVRGVGRTQSRGVFNAGVTGCLSEALGWSLMPVTSLCV